MSKNEIYDLLRSNGIRFHSQSWVDYEICKRLLLSESLSQAEYSKRLTAITDYVGV